MSEQHTCPRCGHRAVQWNPFRQMYVCRYRECAWESAAPAGGAGVSVREQT
jgi:hypothetical protein